MQNVPSLSQKVLKEQPKGFHTVLEFRQWHAKVTDASQIVIYHTQIVGVVFKL